MSETAVKWELVPTARGYNVRVDGELMTFAQAVTAYAVVPHQKVRDRLKEGWEVERAFIVPSIEDTPKWRWMKHDARIEMCTKLAQMGIKPPEMVPYFDGVRSTALVSFCNLHGIGEPDDQDVAAEPASASADIFFGWDLWSKSVDGDATPGGPVTLLGSNENTCRFPLWDHGDGSFGSNRPYCGHQTHAGLYCREHAKRMRTR